MPKPGEKRLMLRLSDEMHARITKRAKRHRRSLNSELNVLIEIGLANQHQEAEMLGQDRPLDDDDQESPPE